MASEVVMTKIAFFPLTPLGDAIAEMGQLEELHRIYAPCRITVFAIKLIAELYKNYKFCDESVELNGGIHGRVSFREIPREEFDVVINHGYDPCWTEMLRQMTYRQAYGMEEIERPAEVCNEIFTKWVSLKDWRETTLKKYRFVSEQMAEVIRLINPEYRNGMPVFSETNYHCECPADFPSGKIALFLSGTSALMKYWPIQKYFQLAKCLKGVGITPLFVIGPQDTRLLNDLKKNGVLFYDKLRLSELAYCIAHSQIVIGNDSGPMHLAACFDVPTVHLFSFTGAHNWFQYDIGRHKLVMCECGVRDGVVCGECVRTCIGKIPLGQVYQACAELLKLPSLHLRQIGYFAQSLIGDALTVLDNLEALSNHYSPCEITVFCTKGNKELFENYAFVDKVFVYEPEKWNAEELPKDAYEAIFNSRYDLDSVEMIRCLNHKTAYGYESCYISEEECRKSYDKWLPLSMWDDVQLRRYTSVTEQGASLVRLVDPNYHCQCVRLAENTFVHDLGAGKYLRRNMVLFVLGASSRFKHWGTENYLALARILAGDGYYCLFILGPKEMDYREQIRDAGFDTVEGLSFAQVACLINCPSRTKCVVGNDTGLMHLACILDAPSVTISSDEAHFTWFPYARERHGICYPACSKVGCLGTCNRGNGCMGLIPLDAVLAEFRRVVS